MQTASLQVVNTSDKVPIVIALNPPEDASDPSRDKQISLKPKETKKVAIQEGTMNLFVWESTGDEYHRVEGVWKGIVPTKIQKPLLISPENKEVAYDGMILPKGFNPVTDPTSPGFVQSGGSAGFLGLGSTSSMTGSTTWLIILLLVVILAAGAYYMYRKKKA